MGSNPVQWGVTFHFKEFYMLMWPASFINTENCMGQPTQYWRAEYVDSKGRLGFGCGQTAEEAQEQASINLAKREAQLAHPAKDKLREIMAKPYFGGGDMEQAVRLMYQELFGDQDG